MKTVLIVQARMQSNRLPGKVLLPLLDKPMMEWIVSRASNSSVIDSCTIATTTNATDDPIEDWGKKAGIHVFRGSPKDLLDRFYKAALASEADIVIRVTDDCPLIDAGVIDDLFHLYKNEQADFAANRLPAPFHRKFPIGLDAEIVSTEMLKKAWENADDEYDRDHVMPWFYNTPGRCKVSILDTPVDYGMHRWKVDTPEDYRKMQALFEKLNDPMHDTWMDVLKVISENPELAMLAEPAK